MGCPTVDFFYIGTVLSYESLLYHMLTTSEYSSWTRKRFQAVIEFSQSPLWIEWEDIITDLERGDHAYEDSVKFYQEHKKEMLEGTKVLWENQRPDMYKHLMERRIASEEGFASEYMNDPQTENTRVFKTDWLENNLYVDAPEIKEVCISIDPAVSSKRVNDYSVILVVGRAVNNYFYVLEADAQKRRPDKIIEDAKEIIGRYYKYRPKVVVETNQMQAFFASTLQRDMVNAGIYIDWIEVYHKGNDSKSARIESLVPHIKNGYIKFKEGQKILLSQLKNYPKGHDDAVDALEMALSPLLESTKNRFSFGSIGGTERKKSQPFDFIRQKLLG
jgi:predicted phage terminase large subunit-like protein